MSAGQPGDGTCPAVKRLPGSRLAGEVRAGFRQDVGMADAFGAESAPALHDVADEGSIGAHSAL
jgi:hypothetical protein